MRKNINIPIIVIIILVVFISCKTEEFSPYGEPFTKYGLNCIINNDDSTHIAIITESYFQENIPEVSENLNTVGNANLSLVVNNNVIDFRDTLINFSTYNELLHGYKVDYKPEPFDRVAIVARVDNTYLEANYNTPSKLFFSLTTTNGIIETLSGFFQVKWGDDNTDVYYIPKFKLYYRINENGISKDYVEEYPLRYSDGIPVFPGITTRTIINYRFSALKEKLKELQSRVNDPRNLTIIEAEVEINTFTSDLGTYISAQRVFDDGFTIKSQQNLFTNINGGDGVLGYYATQSVIVPYGRSISNFITNELGFRLIQNQN